MVRTLVEQEVYYWRDKRGIPHQIRLDVYIKNGKINCVDVAKWQLDSFLQSFSPVYLDQIDPGEADSLAYLCSSEEQWCICSADGIVFRTLGCLRLAERGISLQELLQQVGLSRQFDSSHWHCTKEYRQYLTLRGQQEGITGMGLK